MPIPYKWLAERRTQKDSIYNRVCGNGNIGVPKKVLGELAPVAVLPRIPSSPLSHQLLNHHKCEAVEWPCAAGRRRGRQNLPITKKTAMDVIEFLNNARAPSTQRKYRTVINGYKRYIHGQGGGQIFPLDVQMVAKYANYLVECNLATTTIRDYVRILKILNKACPTAKPLTVYEEEVLRLTDQAVLHLLGLPEPLRAVTLTKEELVRLSYLSPPSGRRSSTAAYILGVAAMLRLQELADLQMRDVHLLDDRLWIFIKKSKTDYSQRGRSVVVGCSCGSSVISNVCPYHRVLQVVLEKGPGAPSRPLFTAGYDGLSVDITHLLQAIVGKVPGTTSHSMRRTGVARLEEEGISSTQIAEYGRWASSATVDNIYKRGQLTTTTKQAGFARLMFGNSTLCDQRH
ncbi:hypothetical protein FOL47_000967 [Perkinsus chesapeaki]|uniref:Uncharacterized protein n=1 Tax=Perkinsus chesapeaki TaxID=330153 RepID=A0A7J6KUD7_PERCH|nr:hypothetical protein FOL47_000967 [Perkinsus chesapeaki]